MSFGFQDAFSLGYKFLKPFSTDDDKTAALHSSSYEKLIKSQPDYAANSKVCSDELNKSKEQAKALKIMGVAFAAIGLVFIMTSPISSILTITLGCLLYVRGLDTDTLAENNKKFFENMHKFLIFRNGIINLDADKLAKTLAENTILKKESDIIEEIEKSFQNSGLGIYRAPSQNAASVNTAP